MKIYTVGGAVRDGLLGRPVQDRDYVVVGATPEDLLALGYTPVGKDFPVFLHPVTHEEYALARTERKTAPGYAGFVFHADATVTLEEDLARRDLTINAIAEDETGQLVDPYHGQDDLRLGIFRHVSDAFMEDPVRILRLARFAARLPAFRIAPETLTLMRHMVDVGEVDALVAERVWQECARGLLEEQPSRMFDVLYECGALGHVLPEIAASWQGVGQAIVRGAIDRCGRGRYPLAVCYAVLATSATLVDHVAAGASDAPIRALSERLRVPTECRDLACLAVRELDRLRKADQLDARSVLDLLQRCDALRRPERFEQLLLTSALLSPTADGQPGMSDQRLRLLRAREAAASVDGGAIARACQDAPARIPVEIEAARIAAIENTAPAQ